MSQMPAHSPDADDGSGAPSETGMAPGPAVSASDQRSFPCTRCGAKVEFAPGQDALRCPYCGTENRIEVKGEVAEQDLGHAMERMEQDAAHVDVRTVRCQSCNAETTVPPNATSFQCVFCGSNIVSQATMCSVLLPNAILPFRMTREQATESYRKWVKSRWFAPSKLKSQSMLDASLTGIYLPHWTFDADATTDYAGQRGDAYYVTTWTTINGRRVPRQERRIRWSPARGRVFNRFDDLLVPASTTLNREKIEELTPWDLKECVPFREDYLAGFRAERYQLGLKEGFAIARQRMEPAIDMAIRQDIGGDEQRIASKRTVLGKTTFKHVLLPIWVSAYRFGDKVYQFMVNARTGEVQGQRPYSWVKIMLAILAGLIVVGIIVAVAAGRR